MPEEAPHREQPESPRARQRGVRSGRQPGRQRGHLCCVRTASSAHEFRGTDRFTSNAGPWEPAGQGNRPGQPARAAAGQARRRACSSVPSSPCRQFRARATRLRTTSGGRPWSARDSHGVGSSYSACPRSGDPTLGSPPASIRQHEPRPSRAGSRPYRGCWGIRAGRSQAFPASARSPRLADGARTIGQPGGFVSAEPKDGAHGSPPGRMMLC